MSQIAKTSYGDVSALTSKYHKAGNWFQPASTSVNIPLPSVPSGGIIKAVRLYVTYSYGGQNPYTAAPPRTRFISVNNVQNPQDTYENYNANGQLVEYNITHLIGTYGSQVRIGFTYCTSTDYRRDVTTMQRIGDVTIETQYDIPGVDIAVSNETHVSPLMLACTASFSCYKQYHVQYRQQIGLTNITNGNDGWVDLQNGKTSGERVTYSVPIDISANEYARLMNTTSGKLTIQARTTDTNGVVIGTDVSSKQVTLTLPSEWKPSINYQLSYENTIDGDTPIVGMTTAVYTITAMPHQGDTNVNANNLTIKVNNVTIAAQKTTQNGISTYVGVYRTIIDRPSRTITIDVSDARNRKSTVSEVLYGTQYTAPVCEQMTATRCKQEGQIDKIDGLYLLVQAKFNIQRKIGSYINGVKSVSFSSSKQTRNLVKDGDYTVSGATTTVRFVTSYQYDKDESYEVTLVFNDTFGGTVIATYNIATADIFMRWDPNNFTFSFGQNAPSDSSNTMYIGKNMELVSAGNMTAETATFNDTATFNGDVQIKKNDTQTVSLMDLIASSGTDVSGDITRLDQKDTELSAGIASNLAAVNALKAAIGGTFITDISTVTFRPITKESVSTYHKKIFQCSTKDQPIGADDILIPLYGRDTTTTNLYSRVVIPYAWNRTQNTITYQVHNTSNATMPSDTTIEITCLKISKKRVSV